MATRDPLGRGGAIDGAITRLMTTLAADSVVAFVTSDAYAAWKAAPLDHDRALALFERLDELIAKQTAAAEDAAESLMLALEHEGVEL